MIFLYELPLAYENAASLLQRLPTPNVEVAEPRSILLRKIKFFRVTLSGDLLRVTCGACTRKGTFHVNHVPRSAVINRLKSEPHRSSVCAVKLGRVNPNACFRRGGGKRAQVDGRLRTRAGRR